MDVAAIDRWADARLEYHRAKYRALWGPHAPAPTGVAESVASAAVLEEIAKAVSTTPVHKPVCKGGPDALIVEYRGVSFWTPLANRRYPEKEAV